MPKVTTERERDATRKREQRGSDKLVVVPKCEDRERRERLEKDDVQWLLYYFSPESGCDTPFTYQFTFQQCEMINAIRDAIVSGGDQALAASRGEGKTTLFERMLLKYTLSGVVKFSVLFAATGQAAADSLESIKTEIEENEFLHADYPEACVPVRALEGTPNRAHYQIVSGERHDNGQLYDRSSSKFSWCGQEIHFPKVPGSPSARAIIATRGLDSAVRGLKKKGRRPEVAGIDDPDTEETVRSEEQATKLETRIDRGIAGLGSQKRRVARIMLTTLQNRSCVSYRFTDPKEKPSWHGKRFRFLITSPDRMDLWEEYVQLKKLDWENGTNHAHELYVANREAMEAGAQVANPNRYEHGELSALQFYYDEVARLNPEAVATEYDNDPPEDDGPVKSGISAGRIQSRLSGYPRYMVPPGCRLLSQGIDVQQRGLHWVVKAWRGDATSYVIDYSFLDSKASSYEKDQTGIEQAIYRTILARMDQIRENPYRNVDDEPVPVGLTLIDSGWLTNTIYHACKTIGLGVYPAKGRGQSRGCVGPMFTPALKKTLTCKPGDGVSWRMDKQESGVWLVNCFADHWKSFEHARWLTAEGKPGAAYLFGEVGEEERKRLGKRLPQASKDHYEFCKHLTAEIETEDVVRGKLKRFWSMKTGREQNHYLDASYLADVAAAMQGIKLLGEVAPREARRRRPSGRVEEIGAR